MGQPEASLPAGDHLLPIGAFASLTCLTRKALKTYERYGLLVPAHIDPDTHYRYYGLRQVRAAETIRLLRSVGVPLREVGAALGSAEATPLVVIVERRRAQLLGELAATDRLLGHLTRVNAQASQGLSADIMVRDVPAHVDLVCAAQCRLETHEATIDRLLERIAGLLETEGLEALDRETATYYTDLDFSHDFRIEVAVPVDLPLDDTDAHPPACRRKLPASAACAVHRGPYSSMLTTSACLFDWVAEHDLPLTGEFGETYLFDERDTDDPDEYRTLVSLGIAAIPARTPSDLT